MFHLTPSRHNLPEPRDYFNHFMQDFFNRGFLSDDIPNAFRVDLREENNIYIVEADLPGAKKEDITLRYENGYLTINVKHNEDNERKEEKNYIYRERRFGQTQRNIYIDNIIEDKVEAKFNNGVLTVNLPKKDENKDRTKNILIQ